MKLALDEQETHFSICGDERGVCEIYTDYEVWIGRLRQWFEPVKENGHMAIFRVPVTAVIKESALVRGNAYLKRLSAV